MPNRLITCLLVVLLISVFLIFAYITKVGLRKFSQLLNPDFNHLAVKGSNGKLSLHDKSKEGVTLDDIFISIKTSEKFHKIRIVHIMKTWFKLAKKQTYIFTDGDDVQLNRTAHGHLVNTHCGTGRGYSNLGCKMGTEYDTFLSSGKKWWCRFDDDNYVNPTRLLEVIKGFNWTSDIYVGRLSVDYLHTDYQGKTYCYQFAQGGAGCCISRPLAIKMKPWCGREALVNTQNQAAMSDDCALGFIITALLKVDIILSDFFHSDYENLTAINPNTFYKQVSLGWSNSNKIDLKTSSQSKVFNEEQDPSRFYSLHCMLYPSTDFCK